MRLVDGILLIIFVAIGNYAFYLMYTILKRNNYRASYFINYYLTIYNFIKLIVKTPKGEVKNKYIFILSTFTFFSILLLLAALKHMDGFW